MAEPGMCGHSDIDSDIMISCQRTEDRHTCPKVLSKYFGTMTTEEGGME